MDSDLICETCGFEGKVSDLACDPKVVYSGNKRWEIDEEGEVIRHTKEMKCCRAWFSLDGFTNTCPECEADYNWSGTRLADRSQWGEETGESLSDILSPQFEDEY